MRQRSSRTDSDPPSVIEYDHVWHWRKHLPERNGQRCRMLARGTMNSALVEFEDGHRAIVSRWAVRRLKQRA